MRQRLPLFLLLASALTFLMSLYLPWRTPHDAPGDLIGWSGAPSYAAGLLAAALAIAAVAGFLRPAFVPRLPFGGLGISLVFFATALAVQLTEFAFPVGTYPGPQGWTGLGVLHWGWSYGLYLGLASGGMAGLAGLVLRLKELRLRRRRIASEAAVLLGLGVLVSFLLPWQAAGGGTVIGIDNPAAVLAAAGLILAAGWLWTAAPHVRLVAGVMAAVLTGAAASGTEITGEDRYGTWIGLACSIALVALEASRAGLPRRMSQAPQPWTALRFGAALLLLVALFLPWQVFELPHGQSLAMDGWKAILGTTAGAISLLLLAGPVLPWVERYALEAAFGIALLVATSGIEITGFAVQDLHLGAGAYLGFVSAGLLLLAELGRARWPAIDRRRAIARAVPAAASLACVGAAVVPAWQGVLPGDWLVSADAVRNWFSVAALLLALHMLRLWIGRIGSPSAPSRSLAVTPLLILPLPVLELVHERALGIAWGGVILISLCLLLAAFGWSEQRGSLERLRLPEVLRVDRLPETGA